MHCVSVRPHVGSSSDRGMCNHHSACKGAPGRGGQNTNKTPTTTATATTGPVHQASGGIFWHAAPGIVRQDRSSSQPMSHFNHTCTAPKLCRSSQTHGCPAPPLLPPHLPSLTHTHTLTHTQTTYMYAVVVVVHEHGPQACYRPGGINRCLESSMSHQVWQRPHMRHVRLGQQHAVDAGHHTDRAEAVWVGGWGTHDKVDSVAGCMQATQPIISSVQDWPLRQSASDQCPCMDSKQVASLEQHAMEPVMSGVPDWPLC